MDQKHREYCIRLGNPYMKEEKVEPKIEFSNGLNNFENSVDNLNNSDWLKNSKKFTN